MSHRIARAFEPLLRLLWPASGRHRSPEATPALSPAPPPRGPVLHGAGCQLVRPHLLAHGHRAEARRQRARRRALWLAVHGIDAGPRMIHGVEVPA